MSCYHGPWKLIRNVSSAETHNPEAGMAVICHGENVQPCHSTPRKIAIFSLWAFQPPPLVHKIKRGPFWCSMDTHSRTRTTILSPLLMSLWTQDFNKAGRLACPYLWGTALAATTEDREVEERGGCVGVPIFINQTIPSPHHPNLPSIHYLLPFTGGTLSSFCIATLQSCGYKQQRQREETHR